MLDIENLSYHYKKGDHSLNDVSLHLDKGKLAVLLGKNGSGKSTLMKCLLSLNKGYEGEILLDGKNIKEIKNKEFLTGNFSSKRTLFILSFYSHHDIIAVFCNRYSIIISNLLVIRRLRKSRIQRNRHHVVCNLHLLYCLYPLYQSAQRFMLRR